MGSTQDLKSGVTSGYQTQTSTNHITTVTVPRNTKGNTNRTIIKWEDTTKDGENADGSKGKVSYQELEY